VITLRQPWAWAIVYAGKDIENRATNIAGTYRSALAIHAGRTVDEEALAVFRDTYGVPRPEMMDLRGVVLGVTTLDDQHQPHLDYGRCGFWAQPDAWHLRLGETRPLAQPIPARGALGLWRPGEVLGRRLVQELAR
jgi:hypothetical protein